MKSNFYFACFFIFLLGACSSKNESVTDPVPAHDQFKMYSKSVMEERTINVWLPESYKNAADSLPVMYMADGGIQEDFPHIANTLTELVKAGKIEPLILVGIENTQRRRDLTGFTEVKKDMEIAPAVGGSGAFRKFLADELIPEINKRYRTTSVKSIIGESLAGLFVVETFLLSPQLFDHYIAFDPSLWWNNAYLVASVDEHLGKFPSSDKRIWFAGSEAKDIHVYTKALAGKLQEWQMDNLKWNYSDEPDEKHSTIFRATKEKAIVWTLAQ